MNNKDEAVLEFVSDAKEVLESIEVSIISLEKEMVSTGKANEELVNSLFRCFHTIKGSAGFFNLPVIVKLSHSAESLLDMLRKNCNLVHSNTIELVIETKDYLASMLNSIETGVGEGESETGANKLIEKLLQEKNILSTPVKEEVSNTEKKDTPVTPKENVAFGILDESLLKEPFGLFTELQTEKAKEQNTISKEVFGFFDSVITVPEQNNVSTKEVVLQNSDDKQKISIESKNRSIRIDVNKLDYLLDTVGELVIAESLVTQNPELKGLNLDNFHKASNHLHKIVRNLQDITLSLRMIPIENLFQKTSRLVRDLSKKENKKVQLVFKGEDTEVDKNVLENITDPIVHILRNSIDHGVEPSEERIQQGKPEASTITIQAAHVGSEVWVMVSDDGRGLDRDKILKKAEEMGLLKDNPINISNEEVWEFIFLPGFSTAKQLTDISGRGVGMDVVRRNIQRLNGDISIQTTTGKGTTFILKVPLTLAIIEGMVVLYDQKYYIIPTLDIKETISTKDIKLNSLHEHYQVIKYRNQLTPITNIYSLIKSEKDRKEEGEFFNRYLIIVESRNKTLGIVFDDIIGKQSIVIKPMSPIFESIKAFSGCTILGNGNIGMILDIKYLVEQSTQETLIHKATYEPKN